MYPKTLYTVYAESSTDAQVISSFVRTRHMSAAYSKIPIAIIRLLFFGWVLVKGFSLSYHNKETIIYAPFYDHLIKLDSLTRTQIGIFST